MEDIPSDRSKILNFPKKECGSTLLEQVAQWVPEEQKADYWRLIAHFKDLKKDDEILQIANAMGMLTILVRQVPAELASERVQFREECLKVTDELKLLLDSTTSKAVTVTQALQQITVTAQTTMKALEKATDAFKHVADRVDVKSIGDRLAFEVHEKSIKPVSQLNEKLLVTERKFSDLVVKTNSIIKNLKQARWWIPWVAAFSIFGSIFTFVWYSYQNSAEMIKSRSYESHAGKRSRS
jgi:hypothetical protein